MLLVGCRDPNVKPDPVPSSERLTGDDCAVAVDLYRQRLTLPRRAGTVVSSRLPVRSEEEQAQDLTVFVARCNGQLVGRARRAIVRCWQDSGDAETFDSCNDRF
jgi:hypothetical protein